MSEIQCVVVTPECTEIDVQASAVTLPMFDGEMGILHGHSPLVGRLGYGVLRIATDGQQQRYFVEGGFVQVANNVVSVLTDKIASIDEVTAEAAGEAMKSAIDMPADKPELTLARDKALERARAMSRITAAS